MEPDEDGRAATAVGEIGLLPIFAVRLGGTSARPTSTLAFVSIISSESRVNDLHAREHLR